MSREAAVLYLVNYLRAKFGIEAAAGVTVRYGGEKSGYLGENVNASGPNDMYLNIYEDAFAVSEVRTTADMLGILAHEIEHSHQELKIEKKHKNPDIWTQDSLNGQCFTPLYPLPIDVEGGKYIAIMEVKASQAALDLEPAVTYSEGFRGFMTGYRDAWQAELSPATTSCPGFWKRTIP